MPEYHSKLESKNMNALFEAILTLENIEECYMFFEDVCTINELQSIAQRLEVTKMLSERKTYIEIADVTGASTATISRVNRCLNYGTGGYDLVLERLNKK
jgi:TrpR-related protein YerC/YecD